MTQVQYFLAALLGAVVLFAVYQIQSSRHFKALRWPANLGYYGFRRRVMRYLGRAGWTIDKRTTLQVDFFATKNRKQVAVICLPSNIPVTRSRIRDLASIPVTATKGSPVVCVTLESVATEFVQDGAQNNVRIIWYKNLASF